MKFPRLLTAALSLAGTVLVGTATAQVASATQHASAYQCSGSLPGGTYSDVIVTGYCVVNAGAVLVTGNLTVDPNNALQANNDGHGLSSLTVDGNVTVGSGAVAWIASETIKGNLTANNAIGLFLFSSPVGRNVSIVGSPGGVHCVALLAGSTVAENWLNAYASAPAFDIRDNSVGGNVWITENDKSCSIEVLGNEVAGSLVETNNVVYSQDALSNEVLANTVGGNLICLNNNTLDQFGENSTSNVVSGTAIGGCAFSLKAPDPVSAPGSPVVNLSVPSKARRGNTLLAADGGVFNFGTRFYGSAVGKSVMPWAGIAAAPGGDGYWLANQNGSVAGFGSNAFHWGDMSGSKPPAAVVGVAASPWGDGYYMAAGNGSVFNFGPGTRFYGSAGSEHLAQPIVGIATTPAGNGYYLVAADGGVFSYGPGARFRGSLDSIKLNAPIVGIAIDPVTGGYWLVGSDGGVFSFSAPYLGSTGGTHLNQPVVGIAAAPTGDGYYLIAKDGGVFTFGKLAPFQTSTSGITRAEPITGMAFG